MDLQEAAASQMEAKFVLSNVTLGRQEEDEEEQDHPPHPDRPSISSEEKEFYNLMFGNDIASVRYRRLHCTACDSHIGSAPSKIDNMHAHPVLYTLLCSRCREFYGDGNFEKGEDGTDMFCRWCANGGILYCCSYCSNTFCNKCIKRNFEPLVRKKIEDEEKWKCLVCDPANLYGARAICWALLQHVRTVTRMLKNDRSITKEQYRENMDRDESRCCMRKRRIKRRKLTASESDEDEPYQPEIEELSSVSRRKILRKSHRISSITNGEPIKIEANYRGVTDGFNDGDDNVNADDLPLPMIPCVQSMVEGDGTETKVTLNSESNTALFSSSGNNPASTLQINPIPTANLLKPISSALAAAKNNLVKRKCTRQLQRILPAPNPNIQMVMLQNTGQNRSPTSVHTIDYGSVPLKTPSLQPNVPMVAIPAVPGTFQQIPRILTQQPKPVALGHLNSTKPVNENPVIEINSDSDEPVVTQSNNNNVPIEENRDISKNIPHENSPESSRQQDLHSRKKYEKPKNMVEEEIDLCTEEVRTLFKMIGTELRKLPLLQLSYYNTLRSTRIKTRRFHLAISKAISALTDINDKVIHKYDNWRQSTLQQTRQTRSSDNHSKNTVDNMTIPLDMICTNTDSEPDEEEEYNSDSMYSTQQVMNIKSFQERDTVDIGINHQIETTDRSVQACDVVEKDYEKCIGHSVLTKVEYDPADGSEILKPVIVPAEYNGKFEEQFIFYLQYREENEIQTDDDKGIPDPNETPLKDLIETNSTFVLEMLENIDSSTPNGMVTNKSKVETEEKSDKTVRENNKQSESTNVVKELAKMVTELSEDFKISDANMDNLVKKHSEKHTIKDRRKQVFENIEPEEVNIAIQTLIEEDERSRSSSNNEDDNVLHRKQHPVLNDNSTPLCLSEDECTIID